jgi:hypothetical protein
MPAARPERESFCLRRSCESESDPSLSPRSLRRQGGSGAVSILPPRCKSSRNPAQFSRVRDLRCRKTRPGRSLRLRSGQALSLRLKSGSAQDDALQKPNYWNRARAAARYTWAAGQPRAAVPTCASNSLPDVAGVFCHHRLPGLASERFLELGHVLHHAVHAIFAW